MNIMTRLFLLIFQFKFSLLFLFELVLLNNFSFLSSHMYAVDIEQISKLESFIIKSLFLVLRFSHFNISQIWAIYKRIDSLLFTASSFLLFVNYLFPSLSTPKLGFEKMILSLLYLFFIRHLRYLLSLFGDQRLNMNLHLRLSFIYPLINFKHQLNKFNFRLIRNR